MLQSDEFMVDIIQKVARHSSTVDTYFKYLHQIEPTNAVKQELYRQFDNLENTKNKEWMVLLFVKFSHMTRVYNQWQQIIQVQLHSSFVAESLLVDSLARSRTSWISSTILSTQPLNKNLQFALIEKFSKIKGEKLLSEMIQENKDFTTLVNVLALANELALFDIKDNPILYINERNSIFRNLYQLESARCIEVRELEMSFEANGLVFVQVVNNALILWDNHHTNFKINLNNLIKYSVNSNQSIRMVFRKLNCFDTINYKMNNFLLTLTLKNSSLIDSFINKLKFSEIFKPKKMSITNIPLKLIRNINDSEFDSFEYNKENKEKNVPGVRNVSGPENVAKDVNVESILKQRQPKKLKFASKRSNSPELSKSQEKSKSMSSADLFNISNVLKGSETTEVGRERSASVEVPESSQEKEAVEEDVESVESDNSEESTSIHNKNTRDQSGSDHSGRGSGGGLGGNRREWGNDNDTHGNGMHENDTHANDTHGNETPPLDEGTIVPHSAVDSVSILGPLLSSSKQDQSQGTSKDLTYNGLFSNAANTTTLDNSRYDMISKNLQNLSSTLIERMKVLESEVLQYQITLTNELNNNIQKILVQHDDNLKQLNKFIETRHQEIFRFQQ